MRLILVRHGQSMGNIVEDDMPDPPLTTLGKEQADQTGQHLARFSIEHIVASPLVRCLSTAQPLAKRLHLSMNVWLALVEVRDRGRYVGPSRSELELQFPEARLGSDFSERGWVYAGKEETDHAAQRARHVLERLFGQYPGETVAVFSHGTFNNFILRAALGVKASWPFRFRQDNGCINVLDITSDFVHVCTLNDCAHARRSAAGMPPWA